MNQHLHPLTCHSSGLTWNADLCQGLHWTWWKIRALAIPQSKNSLMICCLNICQLRYQVLLTLLSFQPTSTGKIWRYSLPEARHHQSANWQHLISRGTQHTMSAKWEKGFCLSLGRTRVCLSGRIFANSIGTYQLVTLEKTLHWRKAKYSSLKQLQEARSSRYSISTTFEQRHKGI